MMFTKFSFSAIRVASRFATMRHMRKRAFAAAALPALLACQGYDFLFKPDTDQQGVHLKFTVETPSKADILFVIDNSVSMTEEQTALLDSVAVLLTDPNAGLAKQDTSYRIGITSTDVIGFDKDCAGT